MTWTRILCVLLVTMAAACASPPVDGDGFFPDPLEIAWVPGPESVGPDGMAKPIFLPAR